MRPENKNSASGDGRNYLVTSPPPMKSRSFRAAKFDSANRHWVRRDPVASAFFNCLSAVFPCGESYMIASMHPFMNAVPEPLASQIADFIEQEAGHSREHVSMNKYLVDGGYDIRPLEKAIRGFVGMFRNRGHIVRVGATMCIEHLTAIIASELLKNDHHLQGSDEQLREIWIWHAIEEIEHKAVAFDLWMYLTRDWSGFRRWITRSALLAVISTTFFYNRTRGQLILLSQDGIGPLRGFLAAIRSGFGKGGIGRLILPSWASFLKPGFHPWQYDDRHLVLKGEAILTEMKRARQAVRKKGSVISGLEVAAA